MKLTKSKLKEIIKEELLNEYQVDLSKMAGFHMTMSSAIQFNH